ncbi:RusA family crossover junction endodeoxyribonuclease [Archaeoglobus veneficus]
MVIKTSNKTKKEIIKEIKTNLKSWMENPLFEEIRKAQLDVAIVAFVPKSRVKNQDVDNISKIVLDTLKKDKQDPSSPYLFVDDSQVVRLLVYKKPCEAIEGYETSTLIISFRKHDPSKQMILVEKTVI